MVTQPDQWAIHGDGSGDEAVSSYSALGARGLRANEPMSQGSMGKTVTDAAKSRVGVLLGRAPASAPATPAIPDIANAAPGELLMVSLESRQVVAVMTRIASNNGTDICLNPNNVSMTFRDGIGSVT